MVKVTLNKDLVPYAGPMPAVLPHRAIPCDLTHNYLLACKLIRVAITFFHLRRGSAVFSGYIYDKADASFKIRVYHKGKEVRCVTLSNLGYGGVLKVEVITQKIEKSVHLDLLTCLKERSLREEPIGVSED